jgi:hypothetical protein
VGVWVYRSDYAEARLLREDSYSLSGAIRELLRQRRELLRERQLSLWRETEQLPLALPPEAGGEELPELGAEEHQELLERPDAGDEESEVALWAAVEAQADEERAEELAALAVVEAPELGAEEPPEAQLEPSGGVRPGWRLRRERELKREGWSYLVRYTARVLPLVEALYAAQSAEPPRPVFPQRSKGRGRYRAVYLRLVRIFPHADRLVLWQRAVEEVRQQTPKRE